MKKYIEMLVFLFFMYANTLTAQYNVIHTFNPSDGENPYGSLIYDGTSLYGMTFSGGTNGMGTIFKIMPDGSNYTTLLDFAGVTNGGNPYGDLYYDGTYLYGVTMNGGANNFGTIFKIMPDGSGYNKLLDFDGAVKGKSPRGSLIFDGTYLFGMTCNGGIKDSGVIFNKNRWKWIRKTI